MIRLLSLTLLLASALAFAPPRPLNTRFSLQMAEGEATLSAFEAYEQTDDQRDIAFEDMEPGSGEGVVDGQMVTVKYEARLMKDGKKFDFSDDGFVFRMGEGKVLPGWEKGIKVCRW